MFLHTIHVSLFFFFFFQAEDGIRDADVTGVQTCALPISRHGPGHAPRRDTPAAAWVARPVLRRRREHAGRRPRGGESGRTIEVDLCRRLPERWTGSTGSLVVRPAGYGANALDAAAPVGRAAAMALHGGEVGGAGRGAGGGAS